MAVLKEGVMKVLEGSPWLARMLPAGAFTRAS